ncbi:hypothetical protein T03_2910 [Trichinella britovi]|uniref:Uncharacterized protein n=1 Tax=Trichinella britovi TaxID=45882 RepID=A0A0V1CR32_TRIBR|nr:hypothetical protein T03_2910 [Trichinella britovi]KRZ82842.1 hypothetical protein T08_10654 [Trichinella sp. T8]
MVQAISKYHFFSTVNRKNAYYQIPINARKRPLKLAEDFTSSNAFHLELRMVLHVSKESWITSLEQKN